MSWRAAQLNGSLCDQDKKILSLFNGEPVAYIGWDTEFPKHLNYDAEADNLILVVRSPVWISELVDQVQTQLEKERYQSVYVGVNRYLILGNDTNIKFTSQGGENILQLLAAIFQKNHYLVSESGTMDNDQGKYFNFIQPLTWIYGKLHSNKNH